MQTNRGRFPLVARASPPHPAPAGAAPRNVRVITAARCGTAPSTVPVIARLPAGRPGTDSACSCATRT